MKRFEFNCVATEWKYSDTPYYPTAHLQLHGSGNGTVRLDWDLRSICGGLVLLDKKGRPLPIRLILEIPEPCKTCGRSCNCE